MFSSGTRSPNGTRLALVRELTAAIERWAFDHDQRHRALTWRQQIGRDRASCLAHLNALRGVVSTRLSEREQRAALAALDRLEILLSASGRWGLLERFKLPAHRPAEKHTRDALRAAMKRHGVDATTAARVIVRRIAPTLPEAAQAALLGTSKDPPDQVRYLADKWLRRSR